MKKLVICEKPSVAKIIANELNCKIKKSDDINYYENEQYIVSNCLGHLLCLANPEAYSDDYKQWKNLPIFPEEYQYVPIGQKNERQQKQLSFLVKMIKDKNIKSIINACDAGREGELIFRYVYNHSKTNKPIERLWISSLEKKAIIDGFRNLKRGEDYDTLYLSANARAKSDWLVGMNLTRFYTQIFKNELKEKEVFSVGRVQTLTLSMIVKRDYEIKNFVKSNYYLLECSVNNIKFTSNQYDDIAEVRKDMENLKYERFIEILDIEKKKKLLMHLYYLI